jgi:23S rRNA (uracil1939-C5)-methyltransferase
LVTLNNWMADIVQSQWIQVLNLRWDWYIFEKLNFTKPDWETVQCSFRVSPFSFFQVNSSWAELLFGKAMSMVWEINWPIVDLYCGAGTIWLSFLAVWKGSELVWNELVESAIEDAYHNAKINWLTEKVFFVAWKTEKIFITNPEFADKVLKSELVIVDPPRDWLHKSVVEFLIDLKKQHSFKLLYISCNPQTLARDLRLLHDSWNFAIKKFEAVDMFPQTHHVETIAYLT